MGTVRLLLPAIAGLFLFGCASPESDDGGLRDASIGDRGTDASSSDAGFGSDASASDQGVVAQDAGPGGNFSERVIDEAIVHGQGVETVDFEGDGDLDLVVASSLTDTIRIYLNDGNANFAIARPTADDTIVGMHAIPVDLDGDGDNDLAAAGLFDRSVGFASQGEVTWFENPGNPTGNWTRHEITGLTLWYPLFLASGDLTGDGLDDLVVGCTFIDPNGNGVYWFRNSGGAFTGPIPIEAQLASVSTVRIHDVDGNGTLDVLASSRLGDEVVWYENQRTGPSENPPFARHTLAAPAEPHGMFLVNMDEDQELEVVASGNNFAGGQIAWYDPPVDPRDLWTENLVSAEYGDQQTRVAAADFDGDGLVDVVSSSLEDAEVRVFFAEPSGLFRTELIKGGHTGANAIAIGDLDRDSRVDVVTTTYGFDSSFDRISWWDNEP